jgi:hypothetical protein
MSSARQKSRHTAKWISNFTYLGRGRLGGRKKGGKVKNREPKEIMGNKPGTEQK